MQSSRISQLYRAQSLINDAVARATDFKTLCEQVCRIGVEEGGIACVLARLHDPATELLTTIAFSGVRPGFVGRPQLPADDSQGVSAIAFQTKRRVIVDDMRASPITTHIDSEVAKQWGINSAAAFPLISAGKPIGTFAMFAKGTAFFDAALADLLEQTAAILAFSHDKLQAEAARLQAEERLRLAMSASQSGVWDWDLKTGTLILSDEYYRMFGYEPGESEGKIDFLMSLIPPENREKTLASLKAQWSSGVARTDYEQRFLCKDGSSKWVQMRATIIRAADGTAERMVGTTIDLTERKERERRILQLSRLNAALGKINAAVARVSDFPSLAANACKIAVEDGGFVSAVIRTLDADKAHLTKVADFGARGGFLGLGNITLAESRGVTTLAIRQGKPVVIRDLKSDPVTRHAAADGEQLGINAGAALPLSVGGVPIGTMTVWAANERFIDEQNLDLLQQMADAVAFAHAKLVADSALIARERDMQLAQQAGNIGSWIVDLQAGTWTTSEVGFAVFGLPPADWYPLATSEALLVPEERARVIATARANIASGGPRRQDYEIIRPSDGARRWLRLITDSEFDHAGKPVRRIGTLQDVTEERAAKQQIERATRLYEALSKISEAVARATDFATLCAIACRLAVEDGGMRTALIRQYNPDTRTLDRLAHFGATRGRVGMESLSVDEPVGLTLDSFRRGHLVLVDSADPHASQLSADAVKLGLTAAASYPLNHNGHAFGTFTVFAADVRAFEEETIGLLQKITDAISFSHEKLAADAALKASRRDLELAQKVGRVGSVIIDLQEGKWTTSEVGFAVLGLPPADWYPLATFETMLAPERRAQEMAIMRANIASGKGSRQDYEIIRPADGARRWLRVITDTEFDQAGKAVRRIGTLQDVTEEHVAKERIERANRLYAALSKTNEAVVRSENYETLSGEVCRIIVEEGKLTSAVIRLYHPESQELVEVAAHGPRTGALGRHAVPVNDPHGLAVQAFRHGRRIVVTNIDEHPSTRIAHDDSQASGIVAGAAFPLRVGDEPIGTMTVFASHREAFDDQMADLIGEIADSVAFARAKMISEEAQRDADARTSAIVDSAMDAIITCDEAMRIVVFNDAAQRMFRMAGADATGQSLDLLIPARFRADHPRWMKSFGNQSTPSRAMGRLAQVAAVRSDGSEFPVETSISHSEVSGKRLYTVIMRDVTAKLANQRALAETERRYRSLVETSLNGVMLLRRDIVVYANPAIARIFGFEDVVEVTGLSVYPLTVPEHVEAVRHEIARLMRQVGDTLQPQLLRLQRRDGRLIETQATANSIDVEGEILIQLELRDITTERRALAELKVFTETLEAQVEERTNQLSLANGELAAANRDLESFSYSVAHDLRAPLRAMIGFSQLLKMDLEEGTFDQLPSHTQRISDSAKRMNELIDGLLAVARVTHGALTETEFDCNVLVAEVIASLSVPESVQLAVEHLPVMKGDVPSMRQVWVNLISNAVKYSAKRPQPRIEVGVVRTEAEYWFHVRDHGAGFDPAYADRLFGVFQRLHTQDQFEGTGVGLAIARRIIERHGGRIWAEGRPNEGATFYFALPHTRLIDA